MRWRWPLLFSGLALFGLAGLGLLWFRAGDVPRNCLLSTARIGGFVTVPGGSFIKAAGAIYPEEGAALRLHVSPFDLSVTEVTNDQFARFAEATGYVTEAELFGGSAAFVQRRDGDPNDICRGGGSGGGELAHSIGAGLDARWSWAASRGAR